MLFPVVEMVAVISCHYFPCWPDFSSTFNFLLVVPEMTVLQHIQTQFKFFSSENSLQTYLDFVLLVSQIWTLEIIFSLSSPLSSISWPAISSFIMFLRPWLLPVIQFYSSCSSMWRSLAPSSLSILLRTKVILLP